MGSNPTLSKNMVFDKITNFSNFNDSLFNVEYSPVLVSILLSFVISLVIIASSYFLVIQNPETEKLSPYECGFDPFEDARLPFDIKFYLVALIFVVFDIETLFLIPWSVSLSKLDILGFWSMVDFFIELSVGYLYIWYVGALDWE